MVLNYLIKTSTKNILQTLKTIIKYYILLLNIAFH